MCLPYLSFRLPSAVRSILTLLLLGCFTASQSSLAETVVAGLGRTKVVNVTNNEAIIVRSFLPFNVSTTPTVRVSQNGVTNVVALRSVDLPGSYGPLAIAGPCDVIVEGNIITFDRLKNSGIESVFVSPNSLTHVDIPSGGSLLVLGRPNLDPNFDGAIVFNVISPNGTSSGAKVRAISIRLDGPLSVDISFDTTTPSVSEFVTSK